MKRPTVIFLALVVAAIGWWVFAAYRVPQGVTPQSESAVTVAWLGLATGVVGLLTAIVGLIQKVLELRQK